MLYSVLEVRFNAKTLDISLNDQEILMKNLLTLMTILGLCAPAIAAPNATLKGQAQFASDAPLEKINGTAPAKGTLDINIKDLTTLAGEFKVPVAEMKTGNKTRDGHLQGKDWLNSKKCAHISYAFKGAKILSTKEKNGMSASKVEVNGMINIHCVEKPLKAIAMVKSKGDKLKVDTKFTIALKDFDVEGSKGIVGSKVGKSIDVKVSFKGAIK